MLHTQELLRHRKYLGKLSSVPTTSDSCTAMSEMAGHHQRIRKRRRGEVANPANTLDGLVAKRADDIGARDSLYKRYLTEAEAIEAPTDDQEIKRIEMDPDVSTRTCSVCGYQGKWVSEMIRHKRVHTNERPFRCKYCSRTSKWKADLIRHVAKTHGIRVVSKYSRSKAFDNNATTLNLASKKPESIEIRKTCIEVLSEPKNDEQQPVEYKKPKPLRLPIMYRCVICFFEQDSVLVLMSHLKNVHSALPYECLSCGSSFMDAHATITHFNENSTCTRTDLKINIAPLYAVKNSKPSFTLLDEAAKRAAQELFGKSSSATSSGPSPAVLTTDQAQKAPMTINYEVKQPEMGTSCVVDSDHGKRHEDSAGVIYRCVFCNFYSKKVCSVEEHMHCHTENRQVLMQKNESGLLNSVGSKMNCSQIHSTGDGTTAAEQTVLTASRNFNFGAVLSMLKQQAVFDPVLSLQALASVTTPLPGWVSTGPSAFKQMSPISGEIPPLTNFISYPPGIPGMHLEKSLQQLHSHSSLLVDTGISTTNLPCSPVTVISNFSPKIHSRNLEFHNSCSGRVSSDLANSANTNSTASEPNPVSGRYNAENAIKVSGHYFKRRNALCSAFAIPEIKIPKQKDHPELPENEVKKEEGVPTCSRKDDEDYVDVVLLDE